jgi:propanol-preferring alcohol dehydrogenase
MTLKIERISGKHRTRIRLSGEFRSEHLDQVKIEIERGGPRLALDLEEVDLVDVEGIRFLNACEVEGILALHCSPYIREWMFRERGRPKHAPMNTRSDRLLWGMKMASTYRAVEVLTPGVFRVVERPISKPAAGQVRLRVEACGVCHTDLATVQGDYPGLKLPRVPGHEVVGRIEEIGPNVSKWKIGQRVGVGFLGGQDGECEPCLRGDFANCLNPVISGITTDGGYAEVMIAEARALASIPDVLTSAEAAPLLCAGITTYNALRNAGLRAGDLVGIQGIGGLGHLGVQFARRMGFRTVAINNGPEKAELAKDLGAHSYVDTAAEDVAAALQRMGGAKAILATAPSGKAIGALVPGLAVRGKLIVVGVAPDAIEVSSSSLVFGQRSIYGSLTGSAIDTQDTLAFSVLQDVRPMIETLPLDEAPEAFARMMDGKARFRMVLVMKTAQG